MRWQSFGSNANAQTEKSVQLARGKSFTVVQDTTGEHDANSVVRATSGRKLVLDLMLAAKASIRAEFDGTYREMVLLRDEKGSDLEIGLEESGDYRIFVGPINNFPIR